jgi:hypothetical protein
MKFYKNNNYIEKIKQDKLNAVYMHYIVNTSITTSNVGFFKNGNLENCKNSSLVCYNKKSNNKFYQQFWINSCFYGDSDMYSKETWRNFYKSFKLKVFL